jgi:phosphoribosyl 1,2-cyclic phosphodiesterase
MRLTFLGTRGNIDLRSRRHRRHTSLLVCHRNVRVMIDCGGDWLNRINAVRPTAILITHAHSDHVDGLRQGAPCAVYATADAWKRMERWPVHRRRIVRLDESIRLGSLVFVPVPVHHSRRAPAVGYHIDNGQTRVFYVPDVLNIPHRSEILANVVLYVGDGASLYRPIQRRQNGSFVGHASVESQVSWCAQAGAPQAIFTHCGTGIVANPKNAERAVTVFGYTHGIQASVAFDGLVVHVTRSRVRCVSQS